MIIIIILLSAVSILYILLYYMYKYICVLVHTQHILMIYSIIILKVILFIFVSRQKSLDSLSTRINMSTAYLR